MPKKALKPRSPRKSLLKRVGAASVAISGFVMYGRVLKHYAPPPGAKFGKTWSELTKFVVGKTFRLALAGVAAFVLVSYGGFATVCWLGTQRSEKHEVAQNTGVVRTVYRPTKVGIDTSVTAAAGEKVERLTGDGGSQTDTAGVVVHYQVKVQDPTDPMASAPLIPIITVTMDDSNGVQRDDQCTTVNVVVGTEQGPLFYDCLDNARNGS